MNMPVTIVGTVMVGLGCVLLITTVMLWRSAAEDPEVLAPLEVMADRKFAKADDRDRTELLNAVRPDGAEAPLLSSSFQTLARQPVSEPVRPFRDPFPHDDDAVDVIPVAPPIIDPLLRNNDTERKRH